MYLYRCRLLYSKAIMDFYSNNFFQISPQSIVKVETKHGVDLAIYLNKYVNIDDKDFDEIIKYQATAVEENVESIENSQDFIESTTVEQVVSEATSQNHTNITNNDKINRKKQVKIEGKFLSAASPEDLRVYRENEVKAEESFNIFKEEIKQCGLEHEMKPVGVHYFLDGMKILFDFVADHRIDFRELVKKLAARYRKRIELHQIGVRDEARMIDGLFICGQQLCCRRFLQQLTPISIKMAEVQNAPLNTMKISGYCGRLLCCLAYESDQYEKAKENLPELGATVIYNNEKYTVSEVNVIRQYLKIKKKESMEFVLLKNEPLAYEKDDEGNMIITKYELFNLTK